MSKQICSTDYCGKYFKTSGLPDGCISALKDAYEKLRSDYMSALTLIAHRKAAGVYGDLKALQEAFNFKNRLQQPSAPFPFYQELEKLSQHTQPDMPQYWTFFNGVMEIANKMRAAGLKVDVKDILPKDSLSSLIEVAECPHFAEFNFDELSKSNDLFMSEIIPLPLYNERKKYTEDNPWLDVSSKGIIRPKTDKEDNSGKLR